MQVLESVCVSLMVDVLVRGTQSTLLLHNNYWLLLLTIANCC